MTLVDHLSELRRRIAISIVAVGIGAVIGFILAEPIIELLLTPLPDGEVVFLTLSAAASWSTCAWPSSWASCWRCR